jgi:transcriptional regulator with XRE-family HTH domain
MVKRRRAHLDAVSKTVGGRIRHYRLHRGMTQEHFSKLLGLTFQQVQKYEKGVNDVASGRVPALCDALGITPNDLFDWNGHKADGDPLPAMSRFAFHTATTIDQMPHAMRNVIREIVLLVGNAIEDDRKKK